jgi:hypothetical protein
MPVYIPLCEFERILERTGEEAQKLGERADRKELKFKS